MRWIAKAAVQRGIGVLPAAERINYQFQRRVTRQLPRSERQFRLHFEETVHHYEALRTHAPDLDPAQARLYEFGAGWDLITPLVFYGLGVDAQTVVDIEDHLRLEQVEHTVRQYDALRAELEPAAGVPLRSLGVPSIADAGELEARFGIEYRAPCDARGTGLEADSFDFVSSTYTLEHIPAPDIAAILRESRRILRPGGILSCSVDMQDHYSYFDPSISVYNYLKFSDRTWGFVNSPLHYQNRLRARDYRDLVDAAGFERLDETADAPGPERLAQLSALRPSSRFLESYSTDELAPSWIRIVARKRR